MKRWELKFLRFRNTCTGIIDKDAVVIIGGIMVAGIVGIETILTRTILGIEVDPATAAVRTIAITHTMKYKNKIRKVQ